MKIVIIGAGKVGRVITKFLCKENHDITIIDKNQDVLDMISDKYDVSCINGNGASLAIQKEAGVEKADVVIATTESDEINILACLTASKLGVTGKVARVRNVEYANQIEWLKEQFHIEIIINPELETANEIENIINFPEALRVDPLAGGKADLVELFVPQNSPLIGKTLMQIHTEYDVKILVCAVERNGKVIIPNGNFTINANDFIYITASRLMLKEFLAKLGLLEKTIRNVMIVGGGRIAAYLATYLQKNKYSVKILESRMERCDDLADILPGVDIIHGNGSDQALLEEEGLDKTDALICLTGLDEINIILSLYAVNHTKGKIITKVNNTTYNKLLQVGDSVSIISPKDITAARIVTYVRSLKGKSTKLANMYSLVNGQVEVIEFRASANNKIIDKKLMDIKLKKDILVATIVRGDEVIIPSGRDAIMENDLVVVVSSNHRLSSIDNILE